MVFIKPLYRIILSFVFAVLSINIPMFYVFLVEKGIVCSTTEIFFVLLAIIFPVLGICISASLWTVSNILQKLAAFALLGIHSLILLFYIGHFCSEIIMFIF